MVRRILLGSQLRRLRESRGETPVGRKIGFTNRITWPDYAPMWGYLYDRTVHDLAELGGRFEGFRFVLGPWRWMLVVYVLDEAENEVAIVTIQDGLSARAVTGFAGHTCLTSSSSAATDP